MKNVLLTASLFAVMTAAAGAVPAVAAGTGGKMKTLVTYYSFSGNTDLAARTIAKELNADIIKIEDVQKLSKLKAYFSGSFAAMRGKTFEIKPVVFDANKYDRIFVGSPVWAGKPVPQVNAFIDSADFKGKTVIPFVTMGGNKGDSATKSLGDRITSKGGKVEKSIAIRSGGKLEDFTARIKEAIKPLSK